MKTAWKDAALLMAMMAVGGIAVHALLQPGFAAALVRAMAFCG